MKLFRIGLMVQCAVLILLGFYYGLLALANWLFPVG